MNTPGRITPQADLSGDDPVARIATHLRQADYRPAPEPEILELSQLVGRSDAADDAYGYDEDAKADGARSGLPLALAMLCLGAGWIGFAGWALLSSASLSDVAPVLTTVAACIAPLLLIMLIWIVAGRRPEDPVEKLRSYAQAVSGEAQSAFQQLADAEQRLAGAYSAVQHHSREAAAQTSAGAEALLAASSRIEELCARIDTILAQSAARASEALARISAVEAAAPRMDETLSSFAGSLAQSCDDIAARGATLDEQIRTAAIIAEEARLQLTQAHDATVTQSDVLRHETRQLGDELTKLSELAAARVDLTLERARAAADETQTRLDCNNAALETLAERSRSTIEAVGVESVAALSAHMDAIMARLAEADTALAVHGQKGGALIGNLDRGVAGLAEQFAALQSNAEAGGQKIESTLSALAQEAGQLEASLGRGSAAADQFIARAESLLVALDADIREINESMPAAFDRADTRMASTRDNLEETMVLVSRMQAEAGAILDRVAQTRDAVAAQAEAIDVALDTGHNGLGRQTADIAAMRQALMDNQAILAQLNDEAAPQVLQTLEQVRQTAEAASEHARRTIESAIATVASQLEEASGAAIESAIGQKVNDQLHQIAEIADNAVKSAHRATDHLMRQMIALTDSAADLESRIAKASEADQSHSRDFVTERSAQIIVSLQDNAIDVSKWLSHDVSEREWTAYLNGDKSLFARRAVKLLSSADLRKLHAHYQDDPQFQEQVNRYVTDFEAMLGDILAGRNGNNLAIVLLSSDVGKLYVALAQGIERLRVA
jgi:hypothetical protein